MSNGQPRFDLPGYPSYYGGKGAPATVRTLINIIPPHDVYIEPFLGSGRVMRHKKPAAKGSVGMELDPSVIASWASIDAPDIRVLHLNALEHLEYLIIQFIRAGCNPARIVVYCDPPYLLHTRRTSTPTYFEEWSAEHHFAFLAMVHRLRCKVIVSHLPCPEYSNALSGWHQFTFQNVTRNGSQTEQVWCNYIPTAALHEYTFIGRNFREREKFKRQFAIIHKRFAALPDAGRIAILGLLQAHE